jgi:hypothetical protein
MRGERNFPARYRDARQFADNAVRALASGEDVSGWHYETVYQEGLELLRVHLEGTAWVAWLYEIAAENAETCLQVLGKHWLVQVDECKRMAAQYQSEAEEVR